MPAESQQPQENTTNQKPYAEPRIQKLGSLVPDTHGPSGGTIDSLFGGNGGFTSPS